MLTPMIRAVTLVGLVVASLMAVTGPAQAAPVLCEEYDANGRCLITVTPPTPTNPTTPVDNTPVGSQRCERAGQEIPCQDSGGWWVASQDCYVRLADPQPDPTAAVWGGNTTGAIYSCQPYGGYLPATQFWAEADPTAGPSPAVVAQQAIAQMNLTAVPIGIAPKAEPGKIGLVGMPVWMWSNSAGENVAGPVTRTASAGGVTVTATARLMRTTWRMGDGETVVCNGSNALGTAYEAKFGGNDSPTCGYRYSRQGRYNVVATSHWLVDWNGAGQAGQIPLELTNSADIAIGEAQVITVD